MPGTQALRRLAESFSSYWAAAVALGPLLAVVVVVGAFNLDIPIGDQWELIPAIRRSFEEGIGLEDLYCKHNGQSLVFPRLIIFALARLTGWDLRFEFATNILLATATFGVLAHQASRTVGVPVRGNPLLPLLALVSFSFVQWQNWVLGLQIQVFLSGLAATVGLALLASPRHSWVKLALAALAGTIATHSVGNGLSFWPAGVVVMALASTPLRRTNLARLALFLALGAITTLGYIADFHGGEVAVAGPVRMATYVLEYLGGSLISVGARSALIAGTLGVLGLATLLYVLHAWRIMSPREMALYVGLALYAGSSALATALGRAAGSGPAQALSSRYTTIALLFWIAVIVLLHALVVRTRSSGEAPRARAVAIGTLALLAVTFLVGSLREGFGYVKHCQKLAAAKAALLEDRDSERVQRYITWGLVTEKERSERLAWLRARHLCAFRD